MNGHWVKSVLFSFFFFSGCPAAALWALICVGDTIGFFGPFVSRGLSSWEVFAVLPYDAEHVEFL